MVIGTPGMLVFLIEYKGSFQFVFTIECGVINKV